MIIKKISQDQFNNTSSVSITLDKRVGYPPVQAELRIVFNADGSFKIITNLPTTQVKDLLTSELVQFQRAVVVSDFGYPED